MDKEHIIKRGRRAIKINELRAALEEECNNYADFKINVHVEKYPELDNPSFVFNVCSGGKQVDLHLNDSHLTKPASELFEKSAKYGVDVLKANLELHSN